MKIISCLLAASLLFLSGCSVNVRPYVQGGASGACLRWKERCLAICGNNYGCFLPNMQAPQPGSCATDGKEKRFPRPALFLPPLRGALLPGAVVDKGGVGKVAE